MTEKGHKDTMRKRVKADSAMESVGVKIKVFVCVCVGGVYG